MNLKDKPYAPRKLSHLQQVEGARVQEEEADEARDPHSGVHPRHLAHVPEGHPRVPVVDEVYHRCHSQRQTDACEDHPVGAGADELFPCNRFRVQGSRFGEGFLNPGDEGPQMAQ